MNAFTKSLSLFAVLAVALVSVNCGGGGGTTAAEKKELNKLKKTWSISSAELDGNVRTSDFTGFSLTISGSFDSDNPEGPYDYSVSGSRPTPSPWPGPDMGSDGTWEFASINPGGNGGTIVRDPGVGEIGMAYSIDGNELTVTFICLDCDFTGARTSQVNGEWVFVFTSN